jgi:hypothetical protein
MHDLAVRNQADALSPEEKSELFAFAEAGTLLSQSARKTSAVNAASSRSLKINIRFSTPCCTWFLVTPGRYAAVMIRCSLGYAGSEIGVLIEG